MKHIQIYYKVKTYIPQESANQNIAIVRERNDEDQAVPSVMKLIEKLTGEEVDEMILETDVDDTQCSEQIVAVPVPQIADRIVEVVTALHGSESQNEHMSRGTRSRASTFDKLAVVPIEIQSPDPQDSAEYEAWIRQRSDRQRSTRSTSLTITSRFLRSSTTTKRSMCQRCNRGKFQ